MYATLSAEENMRGLQSIGGSRYERVATAFHLGSLAVALGWLVFTARNIWFGTDDFDFLFRRGLHWPVASIWAPHNEHWSTIPILIYRASYSSWGLQTALPYTAVNIVAHVLVAHLLWRVMRSAGVEPLVNAALVCVYLVLGSGASGVLRAFQIGFTGAVLLGWVFIILENHPAPTRTRQAAAWAVGVTSLLFSGVSITFIATGGVVVLMRRGWRAALLAIAPALVTFVIWFIAVGHRKYAAPESWSNTILKLPGYVYTGLTATASGMFGIRTFGAVILVALAVWLIVRVRRVTPAEVPILCGAAGAVFFFFVTGLGRDAFGTAEGAADRYVAVAVALALPSVGLALSELVRWPARSTAPDRFNTLRLLAALSVLMFAGVSNLTALLSSRDAMVRQSRQFERQLVAAAQIAASEPTIPNSYPIYDTEKRYVPNLEELLAVAARGQLPTGVQPRPFDVLAAATYVQLGVTGSALYSSGGADVASVSPRLTELSASAGCRSIVAGNRSVRVKLRVAVPTSLAVQTGASGALLAQLSLPHFPGTGPPFVLPPLGAGGSGWLDIAAAPALVTVVLPPGGVLGPIC